MILLLPNTPQSSDPEEVLKIAEEIHGGPLPSPPQGFQVGFFAWQTFGYADPDQHRRERYPEQCR